MNDAIDHFKKKWLWTSTAATIGAVCMLILGYYIKIPIALNILLGGLITAIIAGTIIGIVFGRLYEDKVFGYSVGAISGGIIIMEGMLSGSIGMGILTAIGAAILMCIGEYLHENWDINWGIGP